MDAAAVLNGVAERSSKEPSPGSSPGTGRKKSSQSSTLPSKSQELSTPPQLEGPLHRKHEWEGHNKKASNRWAPDCWKRTVTPPISHVTLLLSDW